MPRLIRRTEGFLLVEVLIAIVVLGIGVFAAIGVFLNAQNSSKTAQRVDLATQIATRQLEDMRAYNFDDLSSYDSTGATSCLPSTVSTGPSDPLSRYNATAKTYQPATGISGVSAPAEDLVDKKTATSAAGASTRPCQAMVTTMTAGPGITATIYRFVSWNDVECPVLNFSKFSSTVSGLTTTLTTTKTLLGNLPGNVNTALTSKTSLLGGSFLGGILSALLTPLQSTLQSTLNTLNSSALTSLNTTLQTLAGPVDSMLAPLNSLQTILAGGIDLCDLRPGTLNSLTKIKLIGDELNAILPSLNTLSTNVGQLATSLTTLNINALTSAITNTVTAATNAVNAITTSSLNSLINGVSSGDTLTSLSTSITSFVSGAPALLTELTGAGNTTHNMKRLSVGVVLSSTGGRNIGPRKPVWVSTLMSNPADGLL